MFSETVAAARALPIDWDDPCAFLADEPFELPPTVTVWAHRLDRSPKCLDPHVCELLVRVNRVRPRSPRSSVHMASWEPTAPITPYYRPQLVALADVLPFSATPDPGWYDLIEDVDGTLIVRPALNPPIHPFLR